MSRNVWRSGCLAPPALAESPRSCHGRNGHRLSARRRRRSIALVIPASRIARTTLFTPGSWNGFSGRRRPDLRWRSPHRRPRRFRRHRPNATQRSLPARRPARVSVANRRNRDGGGHRSCRRNGYCCRARYARYRQHPRLRRSRPGRLHSD